MAAPDAAFCRRLPKVELHAHLTGSVSRACLQTIWEERTAAEGDTGLEAPETALADPATGQNIGAFFAHFNTYIYRLIDTLPDLATATRAVLSSFAADGVVHLELRTTPRALGGSSAAASVRAVLAELVRWNAAGGVMRASLILSIDRAKHDLAAAETIVDLALALRAEGLPVVGLDLCGDPAAPADVARLAPAFRRAGQLGVPLTLHFAEIPASSTARELDELLSWGPRRLGHTIHVPLPVRARVLAAGIAPELCLSCNVLAGMLPDVDAAGADTAGALHPAPTYDMHHFGWWWAHPGSVSLGTDDVGVFGKQASDECAIAAQTFGLGKTELVALGRRAMQAAFCDDAERQRVESLFRQFEVQESLAETAWGQGKVEW
ncbi:hypothetical protein Q5752_005104 [Cryptotrichosporon argae]